MAHHMPPWIASLALAMTLLFPAQYHRGAGEFNDVEGKALSELD
jgi:hypothetical protein